MSYILLYKLYIMKTTIQVESKTLEQLKKLKIAKRESYDEIIIRLIEEYENAKK